MKNSILLKNINLANIIANLVFLALIIGNAYGGFVIVTFGFPLVVILAAASFILNIVFFSQKKIIGKSGTALAVISVIISVLWLIGFNYFMSNIGF